MKRWFVLALVLSINMPMAWALDAPHESAVKESPRVVFEISREQLQRAGDINIAQMFILMGSGLPFPEPGTPHAEVLALLQNSENTVTEVRDDVIVVRTDQTEALKKDGKALITRYHFENGLYVKGPVPDQMDAMNDAKITITGKKVD